MTRAEVLVALADFDPTLEVELYDSATNTFRGTGFTVAAVLKSVTETSPLPDETDPDLELLLVGNVYSRIGQIVLGKESGRVCILQNLRFKKEVKRETVRQFINGVDATKLG